MTNKLKKVEDTFHYISSNGRETPIKELAYTHLVNAIAKLERADTDESDTLAILRDELNSRPTPEQETEQDEDEE